MAKITGRQIKAARAALGWTIADLARAADVGSSTVQVIEAAEDASAVAAGVETTREHREAARAEALGRVTAALQKGGITFLPDDGSSGPGMRWRIVGV